ncbi:MAG: molybdenum cofactor guanylyltransferase [Halomonadaceae bacterium]|nr:MAG: molybdenum cofactor guanylyltransferase [Halomonadaceae bacterium]
MAAEYDKNDLAGLILAGGRGERLGGRDKGLLPLSGEPFVAPLSRMLRPLVGPLAISANLRRSEYQPWCDQVLPDQRYAGSGPLAGLYEGLEWARMQHCQGLLVVTCDAPLVPRAWAERLLAAARGDPQATHLSQLACGYQPLHGVFPVSCLETLGQALDKGERQVRALVAQLPVQWWDCDDFAAEFLNVNSPEDLQKLG